MDDSVAIKYGNNELKQENVLRISRDPYLIQSCGKLYNI